MIRMFRHFPAILLTLILALPIAGSAGSADTVLISGKLSRISANAIVVKPESYSVSDKNFAVVYLLHGWSGNYRNWFDKTDLEDLADRYDILIVCPDGGYAGWYIDSPLLEESKYATYIGRDVVRFIDLHYHTDAHQISRALCGLSMGGHGAFYLMVKYPDVFDMAGCMSGVMELIDPAKRYGLARLLGPYETSRQRWVDYSCISMVDSLRDKDHHILIDCGVTDPFIDGNRKLHRLLIDAGIPHDYVERFGGHSWNYWINALEYHILFFKKSGLTTH